MSARGTRWLLPVLLLLVAASAAAQDVAGRIEGQVRADDGTPLGGVQITASSPALLGTRSAITDDAGRFRLTSLPVGPYEVRARRLGYRALLVTRVQVRLGETSVLPSMSLAPTPLQLSEMVITAGEAGASRLGTASSTVITGDQLRALPIGRNYREIALLMPSASPSYFGDAISIGGATGLENQYYVDGINVTSPIDGARGLDLPYNFIEQIQMRTGGVTADDAQAFGGVINVVTPSGSNQVEHRVFGFYSSDGMQGSGRETAGATQTGFRAFDAGVATSGPIVRDRLWFFAAYNPRMERRDHRFGFGSVAVENRSHQFATKLSAAVGARTSASLTLIGSPTTIEDLQYAPLSSTAAVPLSVDVLRMKGRLGGLATAARAVHDLGGRVVLEEALTFMTYEDDIFPASSAGREPWFFDAETGTVSGGHGHALKHRANRRSARATVSVEQQRQRFSAGVEHEVLSNSEEGYLHLITRSSASMYSELDVRIRGGRAENHVPSAFVEAAWLPNPKLRLHTGVRYGRQDIRDGHAKHTVARLHEGLLPRIGVIYTLDGGGRRHVFASFGRVADAVALWAPPQGFGSGSRTFAIYPQDPRVDRTGGDTTLSDSSPYVVVSGRLRAPTADDWSAGLVSSIGTQGSIELRAQRRSLNDTFEGTDFGVGNPGRVALSMFPRPTRVYEALELRAGRGTEGVGWWQASYVLSRTRGNHTGDYKTDYRATTPHTGPQWGYPQQLRNATGLLPQDRTHVLKLYGAHHRSRLTSGASVLVASGTPISEMGAVPGLNPPYLAFIRERGSIGRTPTIWDVALRFAYALPTGGATRAQPSLLLDLQHVGSPRRVVDVDQLHYTCVADGRSGCPSATYGRATQYQPPMTARLGVETTF